MKLDRTWILNRLRERSTWLGVTACLASLGIAVAPELRDAIAGFGVAAAGLVAVLTADHAD
ncbi:hypothetical protein [Nisaea sediminum]|uniref:hypothetical protein n=1 Tax=Nisaea sediminum TaxID=2775867 RepID=UPI001867E9D5|nr:hypothetical protein [Nisaea sediminum]